MLVDGGSTILAAWRVYLVHKTPFEYYIQEIGVYIFSAII
jgi:hypothetical protein